MAMGGKEDNMQNVQCVSLEGEQSDEALLGAIAAGSGRAMESLYTRYYRLLYTVAYRMVADPQMAEDLLQDAFLAVWRRSGTYSPHVGAARSWLISILHHRTIDHLRALRRRNTFLESSLEQVDLDAKLAGADVWEAAWLLVQSSQVRAALHSIPPEQRLVIELSYFQGWTQSEIAQCTQTPLGTVKARLRLGLHHLKRALAEAGLDER